LLFSYKKNREESANKGLALWRNGEGKESFKKAVDVTSEMALKVIIIIIITLFNEGSTLQS